MIKTLRLKNIGPSKSMVLNFGKRLNIITGDNGLGKSFLLDISWWAMTRVWPYEINHKLTLGQKAIPNCEKEAVIEYTFSGLKMQENSAIRKFDCTMQEWSNLGTGRPPNPGLVLYALSDGSFAVWDPIKNYWKDNMSSFDTNRPKAYVFSSKEVWDGLEDKYGNWLCNGLIRDWASWQRERGETFELLNRVLKKLSSSNKEELIPGKLTRVSLDDARDIPTIKMPYGEEVPVIHLSSGIKKVLALAYFLVWAWEEHKKAVALTKRRLTPQVTFLIDEIESHLHPSWQRRIIPSLLEVVKTLASDAKIQIITATHSPMIMTSIETIFDKEQDRWFDIDYETVNNKYEVVLYERDFVRHGDICNWLTSEAFDMPSARSLEAEQVLYKVENSLLDEEIDSDKIKKLEKELKNVLGGMDDFWIRWRYMKKRQGFEDG